VADNIGISRKYRTANWAEIRGPVVDIRLVDNVLVMKVHTNDKHNGKTNPTDHIIKIRLDSGLYSIAKLTRAGDLVEVCGPIATDRSIVPSQFENFSFYTDNRISSLKQEASI
jgi:hypothetical protein